jgi:phosphonate transport system substrate-binding protein
MQRINLRRRLAAACLMLLCPISVALAQAGAKLGSAATAKTYTISVVPQYNVVQLHTEWAPLIARISRESGVALHLVFAKTIPQFETSVVAGEPDFAFMNPYHAVMAKRAQAYVPILRDAKVLKGILVVRQDSSIQNMKELEGKAIGFPAPNAFGASLYMRAMLSADGINFHPQFLTTHGNVYRSVLNGSVAAGGGVNTTFNDEPVEVKSQLRILYQTPDSASHPLVAHPRVSQEVVRAVKDAFLKLQKDPEGQKMLADVRLTQPVQADYQRDYLPLEKLKIEKFVVMEKE